MRKIVTLFLIFFSFCFSANAVSGNDFYQTALANIKAENFNEAAINLNKALQAEPTNVQFKQELAFVQYKRKAIAEAIKITEEVIAAGNNTSINHARLCELYTMQKQYKLCIDHLDNVREKDLSKSEKISFFTQVGNAYNAINFFPQAIEALEKVIDLNPKLVDVLDKLAVANTNLNLDAKAYFYYKQLFALQAGTKTQLYSAGLSAINCQKRSESVQFFLDAIKAGYPDDDVINYEIANAFYEGKDYQSAIVYLDKARATAPYDQDIASLTAYSYYYAGDTKMARTVIEDMQKINPTNGDLMYLIGMTWQKEGNVDKAEKYFEKAFKLKPALEQLRVSRAKF
jgi:tetratricopeptide (TPR) repeat protein